MIEKFLKTLSFRLHLISPRTVKSRILWCVPSSIPAVHNMCVHIFKFYVNRGRERETFFSFCRKWHVAKLLLSFDCEFLSFHSFQHQRTLVTSNIVLLSRPTKRGRAKRTERVQKSLENWKVCINIQERIPEKITGWIIAGESGRAQSLRKQRKRSSSFV